MTQQIRILSFYSDLLIEVAAWATEQSTRDEALANYGQQIFKALAAEQRELPLEGLQIFLSNLPAFADAFPQRRTVLSHLEKYLETILAPVS